MPTFDTPEPIQARIELGIGEVRVTADDRSTTVVEVYPSDLADAEDVSAAEQTRVDFSDGRLLVKAPKRWMRSLGPSNTGGSVEITVGLPAGSTLHGVGGMAAFHGEGRLGECQIHTGIGDIDVEETAGLDAATTGAVTVQRVIGHAEVRTGSGRLQLARIDGTASLKNSNGDSWVGEATGELRCKAANGDLVVDTARGGVTATASNGALRVGAASGSDVSLKTAIGDLEVGLPEGIAAHLHVHTKLGHLHNSLDTTEAPAASDTTVAIRARTDYGDISIHRSATQPL